MTTSTEHMAADLATVLADPDGAAVDIVLDGASLRAFVEDLAFRDCPYEGTVLERKGITLQLGAITMPVPTQEMIMDNTRYMVESSIESDPSLDLILTRFAS